MPYPITVQMLTHPPFSTFYQQSLRESQFIFHSSLIPHQVNRFKIIFNFSILQINNLNHINQLNLNRINEVKFIIKELIYYSSYFNFSFTLLIFTLLFTLLTLIQSRFQIYQTISTNYPFSYKPLKPIKNLRYRQSLHCFPLRPLIFINCHQETRHWRFVISKAFFFTFIFKFDQKIIILSLEFLSQCLSFSYYLLKLPFCPQFSLYQSSACHFWQKPNLSSKPHNSFAHVIFPLYPVTCTLGYKNSASNGTYSFPTPYVIPSVAKYGLAMTQITKSASAQSKFTATAIPLTFTNTTMFNLVLGIEAFDTIYFTFSIVAIGTQVSNTWLDMFNVYLGYEATNNLKTWQNFVRNSITIHLASAQTKFSSNVGLNYATFISQYSLSTQNSENPIALLFTAYSSPFGQSYIQTNIQIQSYVALHYFAGLIIIWNSLEMSVVGSTKIYASQVIDIGNNWNFAFSFPQWGPWFNAKCVVGYKSMTYLHDLTFNMLFEFSPKQNFNGLKNKGYFELYPSFEAVIFCASLGNYQCNEDLPFYDSLDEGCYTAEACPVTTVGLEIIPSPPQLCKVCSDDDCIECRFDDRENCLTCEIANFSEAVSGNCQCITGYYKAVNGCMMNCSYYLEGCSIENCSSVSVCTLCQTGYWLRVQMYDQYCEDCESSISNCHECSNETDCTLCEVKYHLDQVNDTHRLCTECNVSISNCENCRLNDAEPYCDTCYPGYVNSRTSCICSTMSLSGCLNCIIPTQCTQCRPEFYLNPTTQRCQLCTNLYQCQECSGYKNCTVCNDYFMYAFNSTDGSSMCQSCGILIPNCIDCSSSNVCIQCDHSFGITSSNRCIHCSVLHKHCVQCQNDLLCEQCLSNNQTYLVSGKCRTCSDIDPNCIQCQLQNITQLFCTQCIYGYTLDSTTQKCYKCSDLIWDCNQCTFNPLTQKPECTLCSELFLVDSNHTCNQCKEGSYVTRSCSFVKGCLSSHIINGATICLMCDSTMHFIYNTESKKCECQKGFLMDKTFTNCVQKCGDGILNEMQCDDGNTENGDGCSQDCKKQENFDCQINEKSGSECRLDVQITISYEYMLREMGANKVSLYFSVKPSYAVLSKLDWKKVISYNLSEIINEPLMSYESGILVITMQYGSDIDEKMVEMQFNLDSSLIKPHSQTLSFQMDAVNGPLTYQTPSQLAAYQAFSISGVIIGAITFIFYLFSSCFHKMIGLQTIQFIQIVYYLRLLAPSTRSSFLYGLNSLKYANGYNDVVDASMDQQELQQYYEAVPKVFLQLKIKMEFLQNCNLMLIPIGLGLVGYVVYSFKRMQARKIYVQTKELYYKDMYTKIKRQVDFVYDRFVFTFTLSLFYIAIFSMLMSELSNFEMMTRPVSTFSAISHGCCLMIMLLVCAISCFQVISGVEKYNQARQQKDNVRDCSKDLEHDANSSLYMFHPLYVPFYLAYQVGLVTLISLIFTSFPFFLQLVFLFISLYLIFIVLWKPYSLAIHNFAIISNQSVLLFMLFPQILLKHKLLPDSIYNIFLYIVMLLIVLSLLLQIFRLYIHYKTIKTAFHLKQQSEINRILEKELRQKFRQSNPYSLHNQVLEFKPINRNQIEFNFINEVNQIQAKNKIRQNLKPGPHKKNKTVFKKNNFIDLNTNLINQPF